MEMSRISSQTPTPAPSKPTAGAVDGNTEPSKGTNPAASPASSSKPVTDTVQISSAGRKLQQEATETAAQTAKEAAGGDPQAKKLLANQEETKERNSPHSSGESKTE